MLWTVKFWLSKYDFCRLFHTEKSWHTNWFSAVIVSGQRDLASDANETRNASGRFWEWNQNPKLPWNDYHGNQWQRKSQGLHSKRSCGIIQPVFCVSIRVCSGNSSAWKGEWSVTKLRPVLDWCNSLSIWSCYCTRLVTCKNLRETTDLIAPSLTELFNKSLRLGCLPEDWKLANIVLVFKKYNKEQRKTTDRSRSKFLLFLKWWRGAYIFNAIRDHFFNLISACQHGFIAERLCVTQLVEVLGKLAESWIEEDIRYLDMWKAFVTANHAKLLRKLHQYGFRGNLLTWLEPYLHNRSQRVTILGTTSSLLPVTSGVPQGSILGPVLFLMYVNSHPDFVRSNQIAAFVDDTKVFKEITSTRDAE